MGNGQGIRLKRWRTAVHEPRRLWRSRAVGDSIASMPDGNPYSKRCWFTFPSPEQVERPILWQMSRKFPDVIFDVRQASVQNNIGIMAVELRGERDQVQSAIEFCQSLGVQVDPIEKSVIEG